MIIRSTATGSHVRCRRVPAVVGHAGRGGVQPCHLLLGAARRAAEGQDRGVDQQLTAFFAPGGMHLVEIRGFLAGRKVITFTAAIAFGLETVTVILSPALKAFLMNLASVTVPKAFFFVKPLPFRPDGHAFPAQTAVTVAPSGTFLTCSVDSLVVFLVTLDAKNASVTTICSVLV